MIRIFLDSSVLLSAAYSATGHSRDLLLMAARNEIVIVISQLVLEETRQNLSDYSPNPVAYLEQLIEAIPFEFVRPTRHEVVAAANLVALKDVPIVAAALKAALDLLVTLDKKHLLGKPELIEYLGIPIVTPLEAVESIRKINQGKR